MTVRGDLRYWSFGHDSRVERFNSPVSIQLFLATTEVNPEAYEALLAIGQQGRSSPGDRFPPCEAQTCYGFFRADLQLKFFSSQGQELWPQAKGVRIENQHLRTWVRRRRVGGMPRQ